ncbi:MAG: hypothetical protein ABI570_06835 [Ilumatobacteraceae bacterium]
MAEDDVDGAQDLDPAVLANAEIDPEDLDPDTLDIEIEDVVFGDETEDVLVDDLGLEIVIEEEDPDVVPTEVVAKKAVGDEDDDDNDLRTEDDVEADLDAILRQKLVASDDIPPNDDEDDTVVDDKTDGFERLQPKRPDELQCAQCFLLVRKSAPGCPVEDDACPLFP